MASSFPNFRQLPRTIQRDIWRYAALEPQAITLAPTPRATRDATRRGVPHRATNAVPSVLHACQASRRVALEYYQRSFEGYLARPVYFNPERDYLVFHSRKALRLFAKRKEPQKESLRHLDVRTIVLALPDLSDTLDIVLCDLARMEHLELLVVPRMQRWSNDVEMAFWSAIQYISEAKVLKLSTTEIKRFFPASVS